MTFGDGHQGLTMPLLSVDHVNSPCFSPTARCAHDVGCKARRARYARFEGHPSFAAYTPRFRFAPSWCYQMATSATLSFDAATTDNVVCVYHHSQVSARGCLVTEHPRHPIPSGLPTPSDYENRRFGLSLFFPTGNWVSRAEYRNLLCLLSVYSVKSVDYETL